MVAQEARGTMIATNTEWHLLETKGGNGEGMAKFCHRAGCCFALQRHALLSSDPFHHLDIMDQLTLHAKKVNPSQ